MTSNSLAAPGRTMRSLARARVTLGFLAAAAVLWLARPTGATLLAGSAIALVGESLRIWASGHLRKSREVTTTGPYRWFGHPLYVGSSIMGVGLAVASRSVAVAAIVVAYLVATLTAAIRSEEAFLRETFGAQYDRYRTGHVPVAEEPRRFSLAQAIANREYRALLGVVVGVLLLVLKATYNGAFWRDAGGP